MAERLSPILAKIERAKKHIDDFYVASKAFFDADVYSIGTYNDLQTRERVFYLFAGIDVPSEFALIAGDALQNLRSALDHLAYQLAVIQSGGAAPSKRIYFPIFKGDIAKYNAERSGIEEDFGKHAANTIEAFKPYKGGNDKLWRLSELNNIDKHRLLVTVGLSNLFHSMSPTQRRQAEPRFVRSHPTAQVPDFSNILAPPTVIRCPVKVGDILLSIHESEIDDYTRFHFDIAFGEPGIIEGESVYFTLHQMASHVEGLVRSFEPLLR